MRMGPVAVLYIGFLGQAADRGTMAILAQSDPKELPTDTGIQGVEVWGFLAGGAVAVPAHLWLEPV
jgi:hypothetical protein